jgi:small GTP-binding protein
MQARAIPDWKIVLLGEAAVGKTSLIQQYILHTFDPSLEQTVAGSFVSEVIDVDGTSVQLSIWDTAGQERYRSLIPTYTRHAAAALIVFDVTNSDTQKGIDAWVKTVVDSCSADCAVYIIGNKTDLAPALPLDDAEQYAAEHMFPFFTTSATDYASVERVFARIARDLALQKRAAQPLRCPDPPDRSKESGCC